MDTTNKPRTYRLVARLYTAQVFEMTIEDSSPEEAMNHGCKLLTMERLLASSLKVLEVTETACVMKGIKVL